MIYSENSPSFCLLVGYSGYTELAVFLTFCSNSKELKGVRLYLSMSILSELLRLIWLSLLFNYKSFFNILCKLTPALLTFIYTNIGG
jgi:hypothetical protein